MNNIKKKMLNILKEDSKNIKRIADIDTVFQEVVELASDTGQVKEFIRSVDTILDRLQTDGGDQYIANIQEIKNLGQQFQDALLRLVEKYNLEITQIKNSEDINNLI